MCCRAPLFLAKWELLVTVECAGTPDTASPEWEEHADRGLAPTKNVQPDYPPKAALGGVEGCVTVSFDVMPDGRTNNYQVVDSRPQGVFVNAALLALRDWHFPERENRCAPSRPSTSS